jgi:hypothetical protein
MIITSSEIKKKSYKLSNKIKEKGHAMAKAVNH